MKTEHPSGYAIRGEGVVLFNWYYPAQRSPSSKGGDNREKGRSGLLWLIREFSDKYPRHGRMCRLTADELNYRGVEDDAALLGDGRKSTMAADDKARSKGDLSSGSAKRTRDRKTKKAAAVPLTPPSAPTMTLKEWAETHDLKDGRMCPDKNHPLYRKVLSFRIDEAKKTVTFINWYPCEPVETDETYDFQQVMQRECAIDASDSEYAKYMYARRREVQDIARDALLDLGVPE